jgi:hypothetical protein
MSTSINLSNPGVPEDYVLQEGEGGALDDG